MIEQSINSRRTGHEGPCGGPVAPGRRIGEPGRLERVQALLHGLRAATTRSCDPLDVEVARRMLVDAVGDGT